MKKTCAIALDRLIAMRGSLLWLPAIAGFLFGYLPAARGLLRVEHWEYNYFYSTHPVSLLDLPGLAKIAAYNCFYLFRFQAGPGLWLYALHLVLRDVPRLYLALNMCLHAANAVLLALWVGRWSEGSGATAVRRGTIAGCLFLLMPAPYESVVWTFFSYKVLHCTLLLGALIAYERFAAEEKPRWAALSLGLLLASYLFLEASLPVGLVMVFGLLLLRPGMSAGRKAGFLLGVLATWAVYAAMYFPCRSYALGELRMDDAMPGFIASWETGWASMLRVGLRWAIRGVGLCNSGLGLTLMELPYHLYTIPDLSRVSRGIAVVSLWAGLAVLSGFRPSPGRRLAFVAALAAAVSGLILLGRFDDGRLYPGLKVSYLEGMSAYHYLPSLFLAAMLGHWIERAVQRHEGAAKARVTALLLIGIFSLYVKTLRAVTTDYVRVQEPTLRLVESVRALLAREPEARVYVDHHLPQAPVNNSNFTDEIHAFHAFALMFGGRIVPVRALATVVVGPSGEVPASRDTAARDARALLDQAARFDSHGERADAVKYARLAADSDPRSAEARFYLGFLLGAQGRLDEAIAHTRAALAIDPSMAKARNNLGFFLQQTGDVDGAVREYRAALRLAPDDALARNNLDSALARLGQRPSPPKATALEELQEGLALSRQGRLDEAIARTRAAASLDPRLPQAQFNLGVLFSQKGLLDEAIAHTRAALALDPNSAGARFNLGYFLHTRGSLDDAEREYREALRLDPNAANARLNLGILLHSQGRGEEAALHCREAIRLNPAMSSPLCRTSP